jgi:FAD:protein FMN transferase
VNRQGTIRTEAVMGTLVTVDVVRSGAEAAIERAFGWFHEIERHCTRFRNESELMQLSRHIGVPVEASAILFEAVRFALSVAQESDGAFDPTVGAQMAAGGFTREHRTGETVRSEVAADPNATYRDVEIDPERRTITLHRPMTLDLGAVAKGLAVDTAAHELAPLVDFAIDAGGDLYLGGSNARGGPWSVGIRHPLGSPECIDTLQVSNQAVCTSGNYERGDHIIDARYGHARYGDARNGDARNRDARNGEARNVSPAHSVASATVVAQGAMLADALATAAFVLGPADGLDLLHRMGVDGLIFTPDLQRHATRGLPHAA